MKNFLITGSRNSGKTTLIKALISSRLEMVCGYETVPQQHYEAGWTYKMVDLLSHEQRMISTVDDQRIKGLESTFRTFGVTCLEHCLHNDKAIVVLDELGRFEKNCDEFINVVNQLLDSQKIILAVLKKEPIAYLDQMKKRNDVILFDLDKQNFAEVKNAIGSMLTIEGEKEK